MRKILAAMFFATSVLPTGAQETSTFSWTGGYIGLQGGYGWADPDLKFPASPTAWVPLAPGGLIGGVYAGYNYDFSNGLVLGAESDVALTDLRDQDFIRGPGEVSPTEQFNSSVNWTGAVRTRLGYSFDRTLAYISGGVAFAEYETAFRDGVVEEAPPVTTIRGGWTIGGGAEHAFTDNLIARFEYRFSDYGTERIPSNALRDGVIGTNVNVTIHDVRIGVGYKF